VHDFEDAELHLLIKEKDYLCVELSVTIPLEPSSAGYHNATDAVKNISIEDDSSPFPIPPEYTKLVLFQGAVPFSNLLDTYHQKGVYAESQRTRWSAMTSNEPRKEYIIMRGPNGKGQCQVAITEPVSEEEIKEKSSSKSVFSLLSNAIKSTLGSSDDSSKLPTSLLASITYVNIPWQNLATDFLNFGKDQS
jgi:hypothetical protein